MSLQIAILKVLASYREGRASLDAIKSDLAILTGAGPEWDQRLKRLAAKVPRLDIFGQHLVLRDGAGWTLTAAGHEVLRYLEGPTHKKPSLKIVARSDAPERRLLASCIATKPVTIGEIGANQQGDLSRLAE